MKITSEMDLFELAELSGVPKESLTPEDMENLQKLNILLFETEMNGTKELSEDSFWNLVYSAFNVVQPTLKETLARMKTLTETKKESNPDEWISTALEDNYNLGG